MLEGQAAAGALTIDGRPAEGLIVVTPLSAASASPRSSETLPDAPALTFSGRAARVGVMADDAEVGERAAFGPPLAVGFEIAAHEWEAVGGDPARFQVRVFDEATDRWVPLATTAFPLV